MREYENSTRRKILNFLKTKRDGATFVYNDIKDLASNGCLRSAINRLREEGVIVRLCRGVYMKPGESEPDILELAKEIDRKNGSKAKLLKMEHIDGKLIIHLSTNGSRRDYILNEGTILRFFHSNNG